MRLVYFGSGAFGVPTLAALSQRHEIAAIVTQPDRPAGRGHKLSPTPIAEWAAAHSPATPIIKPEKSSDPAVVAAIRGHHADAFVVIAFGQKLSPALLNGMFAINLHASLLPRWRGAAPINAAILAGDAESGNSVITLADRIDAGLILGQSRREITPSTIAGELHDLLASDGPELVLEVLARHASNTLAPIKQDELLVTIAPKLSRKDAWIDFSEPAQSARARVHAFNPWPGVTVTFAGKPLKLHRVEALDHFPKQESGAGGGAAGQLLDAAAGLVACGGGSVLRLIEVQPAGGKPMPWESFARGHHPRVGDLFQGGPAPC